MTIDVIFARAGIDRYKQGLWFRCCRFDGHNLLCWNDEDAAVIRRTFLSRLKDAGLPGDVLDTLPPAAKPKPPQKSIWKKGHEPQQVTKLYE